MSDFHSLQQLRDEVKVQAHLLRADLRDEWTKLEHDWHQLSARFAPPKKAARQAAHELKTASQDLFHALKRGYRHLKESLPS